MSDATAVIRVTRAGEEFRGERGPLSQLTVGDFLAVRGSTTATVTTRR